MTNKRGRPKSARENAKNVSLMITPKGWKLLQSQDRGKRDSVGSLSLRSGTAGKKAAPARRTV
jgi:hypothetical protein